MRRLDEGARAIRSVILGWAFIAVLALGVLYAIGCGGEPTCAVRHDSPCVVALRQCRSEAFDYCAGHADCMESYQVKCDSDYARCVEIQ